MNSLKNDYLNKHKKFRTDSKKLATTFLVLSFIVALVVFWWLKLVGITITSDAFCGIDEHTHDQECYVSELICGFSEETTDETLESTTAEHKAEETTDELTKSSDEVSTDETSRQSTDKQVHTHIDECYSRTLSCEKSEHTHTSDCFSDITADTETVSDWLGIIDDVEITNNISENLIAIAMSQVGYTESEKNFELNDEGEKNGYTRYGEWYGNPYGNWNVMFVSFCLHYSNINNVSELKSAGAEAMRLAWQNRNAYATVEECEAQRGNIAFFDNDGDDTADTVGIILSVDETAVVMIMGDSNNKVEVVNVDNSENVIGYGLVAELHFSEDMSVATDETTTTTEQESQVRQESVSEDQTTIESSSEIDDDVLVTDKTEQTEQTEKTSETTQATTEADVTDNVEETIETVTKEPETTLNEKETEEYTNVNAPAMMLFGNTRANITYINDLTTVVKAVTFKTTEGEIIGNDSTVYLGQTYVISMEFAEKNTGDEWIQFSHDENHELHYQIPENIHCEPFDEWHPITAKTENGTIEDVGRYFIDADGRLTVIFNDDPETGECFGARYSNVDFTIEFNATVGDMLSGEKETVEFSDEINVQLKIDGGAGMTVKKTHGTYDSDNQTMEYTIRVEASNGLVQDLVIDDQIWENHYVLRDTIVVTDLEGNIIDPKPVVSDHPQHNSGANEGFRISGFPDFSVGEGFLITYKTKLYDEMLSNDTVDMWNGLDCNGKAFNGDNIYVWTDDWLRVELEKMEKDGKQTVLVDDDGKTVPVIEWEIEIKKDNHNLQGTVIIDTLGNGLEYYTDKDIRIKHYDENGERLDDAYISWDDVTINGNTMSFALPDGYSFVIVYYTKYEELAEGEKKNYTNSVSATINGKEETAGGNADVVGFIPDVRKSASGNDGEYVYFTIEAKVPAVIKDWGNFFLTDLSAFWGYSNQVGYLYVENLPEDLIITAVTDSGRTIEFTEYVEGGHTENTYILLAPAEGTQHHSFNILFNTSETDFPSSKWILNEDATLTVSYKIPFDAKTGVEWQGELSGNETLGDVLLAGNTFANETYLNYTDVIQGTGSATYEYAPTITKNSVVNDDGTIDYTVVFHNTIPGSHGDAGYLNASTTMAYFTDTFDEKLEYVPGSLKVTCYDPWRDGLWMNKYQYTGQVSGNTMNIPASAIEYVETNPDATAVGWSNLYKRTDLDKFYKWVNAGGDYVFTYSLKLKDEYINTTEENKYILDNTAEITWDDDGTSGPVSDSVEYKTGLIDKSVVQENNKLHFDIHVNRNALDILKNTNTLTIDDTMTHNLSVYWDTIKLYYEDGKDNWVDFDSENSRYKYTVTYDQVSNKLTFVLPDELHIRIDYTTLITESGQVSVNNSVKVEGKAQVSDIIDATFKVEQHSGGASGSIHNITLLKQDGDTDVRLPDVTFLLYGPMGNPDATPPGSADRYISADSGKSLGYIGSYTTGADGTVNIESQYLTFGGPYALVETGAPDGYMPLEKPTYFYFYEPDPNGIIQTVTTLIAVENYTYGFVLPETGGMGTLPLAIIGISLMAFPVLYSTIRRKRERRLT